MHYTSSTIIPASKTVAQLRSGLKYAKTRERRKKREEAFHLDTLRFYQNPYGKLFPLNSDQPFASALARLSKQLLFLAALNKLHVCAKRRGDGHFSTQHNIASIAFSMYSNDRIMSNWKALVFSRARHSLFLRKDILLTNICNQVARKRSLKWLYSSTSNNSIGLFGQRLCRERSERSGGRQRTEKWGLHSTTLRSEDFYLIALVLAGHDCNNRSKSAHFFAHLVQQFN